MIDTTTTALECMFQPTKCSNCNRTLGIRRVRLILSQPFDETNLACLLLTCGCGATFPAPLDVRKLDLIDDDH